MTDDTMKSMRLFLKINPFGSKKYLRMDIENKKNTLQKVLSLINNNSKFNLKKTNKNIEKLSKINNGNNEKASSLIKYFDYNNINKHFKRSFSSLTNMEFLPIYKSVTNLNNHFYSKSKENKTSENKCLLPITKFSNISIPKTTWRVRKSQSSSNVFDDNKYNIEYLINKDKGKKKKKKLKNSDKKYNNIFNNFLEKYMDEKKFGIKYIKRDKKGYYNIFPDKKVINENSILFQFDRNISHSMKFYKDRRIKTLSFTQLKNSQEQKTLKKFQNILKKSSKTFKEEKIKIKKFNIKTNLIFQKYNTEKPNKKEREIMKEIRYKLEKNFKKRPIFVNNLSTNNLKIIKL